MSAHNNGKQYTSNATPSAAYNQSNAASFLVWSILTSVRTMAMVKIVAVTNAGGLSPVGFVDIQPMVNQITSDGLPIPHGTIYHCPYLRLQGGANAVILDPQVGDIGWAGFADRDITRAVATKAQASPSSLRKFNMADAVYIGGMLNGTPSQYVAFSSDGISIVSPTKITMSAPSIVLQATETIGLTAGTEITNSAPAIEMDGQMTQGEGPQGGNAAMQGPLTVVQDVVAAGTSVHGHTHTAQGDDAVTTPPN